MTETRMKKKVGMAPTRQIKSQTTWSQPGQTEGEDNGHLVW